LAILLNHNLGGDGTVTGNLTRGIDSGHQGTGHAARFVSLQSGFKLSRYFEELAVPRLPDPEERARVQTAFERAAAIQPFFECLIDEILFKPLPACVFQYAGQPNAFLPVQF
jgi:hypothetical protein